jgi:hypothetical protein
VLTRGGYTHYREKTSTYIQELCTLLKDKYDGDASKLRGDNLQTRLKEFKGIGDNGAEIFMRGAQVWWDELSPFLDQKRGQARAEQLYHSET